MAWGVISADEFSQGEVDRWMQQFEQVAKEGRRLWTSPELVGNGVVCTQCHPNAANTHPETYPKFQTQIGKRLPGNVDCICLGFAQIQRPESHILQNGGAEKLIIRILKQETNTLAGLFEILGAFDRISKELDGA